VTTRQLSRRIRSGLLTIPWALGLAAGLLWRAWLFLLAAVFDGYETAVRPGTRRRLNTVFVTAVSVVLLVALLTIGVLLWA
jgi:ABC-type Mn2+/Zn2+ transport system permease subunit